MVKRKEEGGNTLTEDKWLAKERRRASWGGRSIRRTCIFYTLLGVCYSLHLESQKRNMQDCASLSKVRWEDEKNGLKHNTLPCGILYLAVLTNKPQLMSPQGHLDWKGLPCASKHINCQLYLVWGVTVQSLFSSLFITVITTTTIITIPHQKRFSGGWQSLQIRGKPDCHKHLWANPSL